MLSDFSSTLSAPMGCLRHNLVFESQQYTAHYRQEDTQDLEQAEGLVKNKVVEGGNEH